jgi:hypothetical protein
MLPSLIPSSAPTLYKGDVFEVEATGSMFLKPRDVNVQNKG